MAEKRKIEIKGSIKFGWNVAKKNFKFFLGLFVIILLVNFIPQMVTSSFKNPPLFVVIPLSIAIAVVRLITDLGMIKIALSFADGIKPKYSLLYSKIDWRMIGNFLIGSILYNLMVLLGVILLIIPGIYLGIRFQYFSMLIIDKNMKPMDALRTSSKMTEGIKWELFKFGLLQGLINIAGALALAVGLLLTVPTTMVANAHMYRKLQKQA